MTGAFTGTYAPDPYEGAFTVKWGPKLMQGALERKTPGRNVGTKFEEMILIAATAPTPVSSIVTNRWHRACEIEVMKRGRAPTRGQIASRYERMEMQQVTPHYRCNKRPMSMLQPTLRE